MKTPNGYAEIQALFGNPANPNGSLNQAWAHAHIQVVMPPPGWKLYYQESATKPLVPIQGIQMHVLLKGVFTSVMTEIWEYAKQQLSETATETEIQNWLHNLCLDQTGGGFNYRKSTGDTAKLSLHSYGIAIDWDPVHNPHQRPLTWTLPDWWYGIWAEYGWTDGRHFLTPDPMHVQFATGA